MRPLDALLPRSPIARLLASAPADDVRVELARLDGLGLGGVEAAAAVFARGALALREGALDAAHRAFGESADAFAAAGQPRASALARCEAWLAAIRRGPRAVYAEATAALDALVEEHSGDELVAVVAGHYRGTAERFSGDPVATQRTLLAAFSASEPFLPERAQILNSLGTLYVVLGAHGAARSLLEHAAELHHQHGDAVGEAIAMGQLGSAALARGELEEARRFLQKQEWFASRVGDAFGRARALTFLADLALELGRPDDAVTLATKAREIAESVTPPLSMWVAYAERALGRAKVELGDDDARAHLDDAAARFAKIGNLLGDALVRWDRAHLAAATGADEPGHWFEAAWALGSLGLVHRVARILVDRAHDRKEASVPASPSAEVVAAAAQAAPQLAVAHELELVYADADALARIATRRSAGQRNLGRLAALAAAPCGLWVAALAGAVVGRERPPVPGERSAAVLVGALPGVALWAWPCAVDGVPQGAASVAEVARDLASARKALGDDLSAALTRADGARVTHVPFTGEGPGGLSGVDTLELVRAALAGPAGKLHLDPAVGWTAEAAGLVAMAGWG